MEVTNLDLTFDEAKAILSDGKLVIASRKELEEAEAAWKERDTLRAQLKASQADVKLLRKALEEAACWVPDGSYMTAVERGAKCETAGDMREMVSAALTATAPKGVE